MKALTPPWRPAAGTLLVALGALAAGCSTTPTQPASYPTLDRVRYVQECMTEHRGPVFEMTEKCSCAIDRIAEKVPHDEYIEMVTAFNANTIGGERGSYIRDVAILQEDIKRYRALQAEVQKSCFIGMGIR